MRLRTVGAVAVGATVAAAVAVAVAGAFGVTQKLQDLPAGGGPGSDARGRRSDEESRVARAVRSRRVKAG
jgi:hypothetical protein